MSDIKMLIEARIEADCEKEARQYAAAHGIDVSHAKWYPSREGENGRLYVTTTTPFPTVQLALADKCGGCGVFNKFCSNPSHKITRNGAIYLDWQCDSCGGTGRTTWD